MYTTTEIFLMSKTISVKTYHHQNLIILKLSNLISFMKLKILFECMQMEKGVGTNNEGVFVYYI